MSMVLWFEVIGVALLWWLVLNFRRRRLEFRISRVPAAPDGVQNNSPLVSIIVPARNEAAHIEACVRSLLGQDYPRFEVIVVDDCSEDGSGAILDRLGKEDPRLRVIRGTALPPGWMGKVHAIDQGYRVSAGDWLLFTDADTWHASHLLSGVMALLEHSDASFATVIGRQRHPGLGVYLANLGVFTYISLVTDPQRFCDPRSPQSLVNGQYLAFWRTAYEALGTHRAVRGFSSTDASLGYLAKREGYLPAIFDAGEALTTTMYESFPAAFRGWSRSLVNGAWTALGPRWGSLFLSLAMLTMLAMWAGPWLLLALGIAGSEPVGSVCGVLAVAAHVVWMRVDAGGVGVTLGRTLAMPFAAALMSVMATNGLAGALLRGGTVWKGRVVATRERLPAWLPKPQRPRPPASR